MCQYFIKRECFVLLFFLFEHGTAIMNLDWLIRAALCDFVNLYKDICFTIQPCIVFSSMT